MHPSTRRLALRAATKVTLSAAVFGCGGATLTDDDASAVSAHHMDSDASPDAASKDAATNAVVDASAGRDVHVVADADEPVCQGSTINPKGTVSAAASRCCTAYLTSQLGDGGDGLPVVDASAKGTKECCATVIAFVDDGDGGFDAFEAAEPLLPSCCELTGTPIGRACTPWGPPVPPAMPSALLEVA